MDWSLMKRDLFRKSIHSGYKPIPSLKLDLNCQMDFSDIYCDSCNNLFTIKRVQVQNFST